MLLCAAWDGIRPEVLQRISTSLGLGTDFVWMSDRHVKKGKVFSIILDISWMDRNTLMRHSGRLLIHMLKTWQNAGTGRSIAFTKPCAGSCSVIASLGTRSKQSEGAFLLISDTAPAGCTSGAHLSALLHSSLAAAARGWGLVNTNWWVNAQPPLPQETAWAWRDACARLPMLLGLQGAAGAWQVLDGHQQLFYTLL